MNRQDDDVFLTTEEVLEYLHVNLRTVYRLIKAGKIPAVRVGRQWRFRKRDIDGWLETQRPHSDMVFSPAQQVSRISHDMSLMPGDVIACGTSLGVGSIKDGSTVEVSIDGIGTLKNSLGEPRWLG